MQLVNKTPFDVFVLASQIDPPRPSATIVVKATFAIAPDAVAEPLPDEEQDKMQADQPYMDEIGRSLSWANDLEPLKPFAEVVVHGGVFPPGGRPAPTAQAAVRIGEWEKRVVAFGDRVWTTGADGRPAPTEPVPFSVMPLRWEYAFGGLDDDRNPMGRGIDSEIEIAQGTRGIALPNIEDPAALVASPGDRPHPVNLAPMPPSFMERFRKLGTRDKRWSTFRAPLPPDDFDPAHHNAAPEDQQFAAAFRGDEAIEVEGLHPEHERLRFQLAGLRLRAFMVRQEDKAEPTVEETPLDIDTLALMPDQDKLVALWRGYGAVAKDGLEDLLGLYVVQEPLAEAPLPAGTYLPEIRETLFPAATGPAQADVDAEVGRTLGEAKGLLDKVDLPDEVRQKMVSENDPKKLFDMLIEEIHRQANLVKNAAKGPR